MNSSHLGLGERLYVDFNNAMRTTLWNKMFSTESRGRMVESCRYAKTETATLSKRSRAILMFHPQRAPHHPAINVFPNFCSYSAECPLAVLVASHQQRHSFFFVRCPGQSLLRLHIFASNATQLLYRACEKYYKQDAHIQPRASSPGVLG